MVYDISGNYPSWTTMKFDDRISTSAWKLKGRWSCPVPSIIAGRDSQLEPGKNQQIEELMQVVVELYRMRAW